MLQFETSNNNNGLLKLSWKGSKMTLKGLLRSKECSHLQYFFDALSVTEGVNHLFSRRQGIIYDP